METKGFFAKKGYTCLSYPLLLHLNIVFYRSMTVVNFVILLVRGF